MSYLFDTIIPILVIIFLICSTALPEIMKGAWMVAGSETDHSIAKVGGKNE